MREFKKVAEARLKEEVDKNGLLSGKVQMLQRELQEARQEATRYRARLAQLGNPVTISEVRRWRSRSQTRRVWGEGRRGFSSRRQVLPLQLLGRDRFNGHVPAVSIFVYTCYSSGSSVVQLSIHRSREYCKLDPTASATAICSSSSKPLAGTARGIGSADNFMHSVRSDFQEPTEVRPRPAGHHGLEEQELAARPDQNKTLSAAAAAAGGAPAAAAAAAAPSKHGKHEQMPAPYHTIPAEVDRNEVDRNTQNQPTDGRGRPDSSQQAVEQGESKQVRMGRALLTCGDALTSVDRSHVRICKVPGAFSAVAFTSAGPLSSVQSAGAVSDCVRCRCERCVHARAVNASVFYESRSFRGVSSVSGYMYPFSPSFGVLPRGQINLSLSVSGVIEGQALQALDNKTLRLCFDKLAQRSCPSSAALSTINFRARSLCPHKPVGSDGLRFKYSIFLPRIVSG